MNKVRSGCDVRVIMTSVFEKNKDLFVLWFVKFQFLMITISVIRKFKYDETSEKSVTNNIGGVKRKDRCCNCYCGPGKYLSFMDRIGVLGEDL